MRPCLWPECATLVNEPLLFCKGKACREARVLAGERGLTHDEYAAWGVWADAQKERQRRKDRSEKGVNRRHRYRRTETFRERNREAMRARYAPIKEQVAERKIVRARQRRFGSADSVVTRNARLRREALTAAMQTENAELLALIAEQSKDMRTRIVMKEHNATPLHMSFELMGSDAER